MARLTVILLLAACGLAAAPVAQAGEEFTERAFTLPGHGALTLWAPESWRHEIRQPKGVIPPTISFLPTAGQDFLIFITPVWPAENPPAGYNSSGTIRALVEESAGVMQKSAVEERLEVRPIDGATGFYFSATDAAMVGRTPPPGEYRHLIQGILAVGDLLCTFTVLTNDPDYPTDPAFAALGTAAHRPGR